jgi:hypothetical protein
MCIEAQVPYSFAGTQSNTQQPASAHLSSAKHTIRQLYFSQFLDLIVAAVF